MALSYLDKQGLQHMWDNIKTVLDTKANSNDVLPLSGGTLTGDVIFNSLVTMNQILYTNDIETNSLLVKQSSRFKGQVFVESSITATGGFAGNASTSTKLLNPRAIKIGDTSKQFDGSEDLEYTLTEIGLGNVTNDAQVKRSEMGVANGVATLDSNGLISDVQIPNKFVDLISDQTIGGIKTFSNSTANTVVVERNNGNYFSGIQFKNTNGVLGSIGMKDNGSALRYNEDFTISYTFLDTQTYTDYVPKKDGTGATGNWNINAVTSTSASKLSITDAVGSVDQPIYFDSTGTPVSCTRFDISTYKRYIDEYMQRDTTNYMLLKSKAGTFDMTVTGFVNPVWEYNGTTISGNNGQFTILNTPDYVKLSWDSIGNSVITVNTAGKSSLILDLGDFYGKITTGIFLNDTAVTGDLSELHGILKSNLYCNNTKISGDIASLNGNLTSTLYCGNTSIYGDIASLQAKITYAFNCQNTGIYGDLASLGGKISYSLYCNNANVYGVYSPQNVIPTSTNLSNTQITTSDMDSTLIAYASKATDLSKSNGTFVATGMTRTSASDNAVTTLTNLGWKITGLTVVTS